MMTDIIYQLKQIDGNSDFIYTLIRVFMDYAFAVFIIRSGNNRMQLNTPMDFILVIIMGGVLVENVNGSINLHVSLVICCLLRIVHAILSKLCYQFPAIDKFFKGSPEILIENGKLNKKVLKANHITQAEVLEACRLQINTDDIRTVKIGRLERSGRITITVNKSKD